jgi:hypothetical protein
MHLYCGIKIPGAVELNPDICACVGISKLFSCFINVPMYLLIPIKFVMLDSAILFNHGMHILSL